MYTKHLRKPRSYKKKHSITLVLQELTSKRKEYTNKNKDIFPHFSIKNSRSKEEKKEKTVGYGAARDKKEEAKGI